MKKTNKYNIYETKTHLSEIVARVEETGASYTICRNGKPECTGSFHMPYLSIRSYIAKIALELVGRERFLYILLWIIERLGMNRLFIFITTIISACLFVPLIGAATTHYVWTNSVLPTSPYTNWQTAAHVIQDAVDVAQSGDQVLVTNGVYNTGGRLAAGANSRVCITSGAITVCSVNGPEITVIRGQGPHGPSAVRGVYLAEGSVLSGFTITNGFTGDASAGNNGGGVFAASIGATISNCYLTGNAAVSNGGGVFQGTLYNSTIHSNTAYYGGGASHVTMHNCAIIGNTAYKGGGIYQGQIFNSTITSNSADIYGGGMIESTLYNCNLSGNSALFGGGTFTGMAYNCILIKNSADTCGGASSGTTLNNCFISDNSSGSEGGGVCEGTLHYCTLTGNSTFRCGGGAENATLYNCIVYYNNALVGPDLFYCTYSNTCTTAGFAETGNFTNNPGITSIHNPHLLEGSVCIDAGIDNDISFMTDIDGENRTNGLRMDVGCDERWDFYLTGILHTAISTPIGTNAAEGCPLPFQSEISGKPSSVIWTFGDGTLISNICRPSHAFATAGVYEVTLQAINDDTIAMATTSVQVISVSNATWYVKPTGNDHLSGRSWSEAKETIQGAVDEANVLPGAFVIVTNGLYETSGAYATDLTNRVVITNAITVRSVNGPEATSIKGHRPMGVDAVRCVYLADGAMLAGFTLTNGGVLEGTSEPSFGGGVFGAGTRAVVSNCVLTENSANTGGGAFNATLYNCIFTTNTASDWGGGAHFCILYDCKFNNNTAGWDGGGACASTLFNCSLKGNHASSGGGGASESTLHNCLLMSNHAFVGGGTYISTLCNCLLVTNCADIGGGTYSSTQYNCTLVYNWTDAGAGGAHKGVLHNCIVWSNAASDIDSVDIYYSCCPSTSNSVNGNTTNDPQFINWLTTNLQLQAGSPCIDAGANLSIVTTDINGIPRPLDGNHDGIAYWDMGAYEFIDPQADTDQDRLLDTNELAIGTNPIRQDTDNDDMMDGNEIIAGTDPLNKYSFLGMTSPDHIEADGNLVICWQSVSGITYQLERSTNLSSEPAFTNIATAITGQQGTTCYTDTFATINACTIYRISIVQ